MHVRVNEMKVRDEFLIEQNPTTKACEESVFVCWKRSSSKPITKRSKGMSGGKVEIHEIHDL